MSDEVVLTIYYIRHGESYGNIGNNGGVLDFPWSQSDPPLTPEGKEQAALAAERMAKGKLHAVYSSPLERAAETAHFTAKRQGDLPVILLPDLFEQGTLPGYKGHPPEYFKKNYPLCVPCLSEPTLTGGGLSLPEETSQMTLERAKRCVSFLRKTYSAGEEIALFSHGTFFGYFISAALGLAMREDLRFSCYNTGVSKFKFYNNGTVKLSFMNDTAHLFPTKSDLTYTI